MVKNRKLESEIVICRQKSKAEIKCLSFIEIYKWKRNNFLIFEIFHLSKDFTIDCSADRAIDQNIANGEIPFLFNKNQEHGWLIVPFYFDSADPVAVTHSETERNIIREKLRNFEQHTCIKVREEKFEKIQEKLIIEIL